MAQTTGDGPDSDDIFPAASNHPSPISYIKHLLLYALLLVDRLVPNPFLGSVLGNYVGESPSYTQSRYQWRGVDESSGPQCRQVLGSSDFLSSSKTTSHASSSTSSNHQDYQAAIALLSIQATPRFYPDVSFSPSLAQDSAANPAIVRGGSQHHDGSLTLVSKKFYDTYFGHHGQILALEERDEKGGGVSDFEPDDEIDEDNVDNVDGKGALPYTYPRRRHQPNQSYTNNHNLNNHQQPSLKSVFGSAKKLINNLPPVSFSFDVGLGGGGGLGGTSGSSSYNNNNNNNNFQGRRLHLDQQPSHYSLPTPPRPPPSYGLSTTYIKLMGGYPMDAVDKTQAGSPNGVLELARKYGYREVPERKISGWSGGEGGEDGRSVLPKNITGNRKRRRRKKPCVVIDKPSPPQDSFRK